MNARNAGSGVPAGNTEDTEQSGYPRRVVILTMLGVLMVMLLASLDQTIVGTAMPRIIAELNGFDRYTWVTTSYLLASTVMVPIYGKLSDILGRKPILMFSLSLFLVGSWLSGASQTMTALILFRGLQGLGAGGLMSIAIAIVGDLFTPRERAKWQGVTGAVFGLAFILGPTAGGWITDHLSWRWVFYVNMPLGLAALAVLAFLMPTLIHPEKHTRIDYIGAGLLAAGVVPLLLGLTWAGSEYDWISPQILGLLGVALVVLAGFVFYELRLERRGGQPIIEPTLFKSNVFTVSVLATAISGIAMIGSIYYIPLFVQGVVGTSATNSGAIMTPMMVTAMVSSIGSGQIVARTGRYKWQAVLGSVIMAGGVMMLLRLNVHSTNTDVVLAMLVMGLGMGVGMSLFTLIVQNAFPTKIGQASAAMTFFRQIGSTVGLAALGSVMNSLYPGAFKDALPSALAQRMTPQMLRSLNNPQVLLSPEAQTQLHRAFARYGAQGEAIFNSLMEAVKTALTQSLHGIFLASLVISLVSVVVLLFLKEIPLRGRNIRRAPAAEQAASAIASVSGEEELAVLD